jgi:CMP-N-acetylneuraminic acid synthetase
MVTPAYAIVPARSGSKRILGKHTRSFLGKPIIFWVLEEIEKSGLFETVLVSSEDTGILRLVDESRLAIPLRRPDELAEDHVPTAGVANHAITNLLQNGAPADSHFFVAYPTAVFTTAEHIRKSRELLVPGEIEFVFSGAAFPSELHRAWWKSTDGSVAPVNEAAQQSNSQDLPVAYYDAGQFYWSTKGGWNQSTLATGKGRRIYELDPIEAVDVNTESDWERAEKVFSVIMKGSRGD